jgi:hypothetical protein
MYREYIEAVVKHGGCDEANAALGPRLEALYTRVMDDRMGLRPWPQQGDDEKIAALEASLPTELMKKLDAISQKAHDRLMRAYRRRVTKLRAERGMDPPPWVKTKSA